MKIRLLLAPALLAALVCLNAGAAQAPDGRQVAAGGGDGAACVACHGLDGARNEATGFPRLAGLNAQYLQTQLDQFADGSRQNAVMTPIAKTLSVEQRKAVAAFYAAQPWLPSEPAKDAAKLDQLGGSIAQDGRASRDVESSLPACQSCHGPDGVGVGATFPVLAGQSSRYLESQLRAWQQGTRPPGPLGMMASVAKSMSDDELEAVSRYFASLAPANIKDRP